VAIDDLAIEPTSGIAPARPELKPDPRGGHLLLVEDHPELAAYLHERLSEFIPVRLAGTADEAFAEIRRSRPGLLLSDVVLPGDSGVDLCSRLRRDPDLATLPIILISARAADHDRTAGLAAGADDYLAKPFALDELLQAIGRLWPTMRARLQPPAVDDAGDPLLGPALHSLGDGEFGVREWAVAVHLSERQLRRRVAERTAQSPLVWLREQRLLRVRQLIDSGTCKTLAQAGARCGLGNPQYLYRLYRARFGSG
jgi:DNA-binding response OmpR family regulator